MSLDVDIRPLSTRDNILRFYQLCELLDGAELHQEKCSFHGNKVVIVVDRFYVEEPVSERKEGFHSEHVCAVIACTIEIEPVREIKKIHYGYKPFDIILSKDLDSITIEMQQESQILTISPQTGVKVYDTGKPQVLPMSLGLFSTKTWMKLNAIIKNLSERK